jgi:hypothetical protein
LPIAAVSSGEYNLEITGDKAKTTSCDKTVPETKVVTDLAKSLLNLDNLKILKFNFK